MSARGLVNVCLFIAMFLAVVAYWATGGVAFAILFGAAAVTLYVRVRPRWYDGESDYPIADDLRRAGEEPEPKPPSMLGRFWPWH